MAITSLIETCLECLGQGEGFGGACWKCGGRGRFIILQPMRNAITEVFRDTKKMAQKMREENNALNDSVIELLEEKVLAVLEQFES